MAFSDTKSRLIFAQTQDMEVTSFCPWTYGICHNLDLELKASNVVSLFIFLKK